MLYPNTINRELRVLTCHMLTATLTKKLRWFVGSLVNEALEGLLHGIDEVLVPLEATVRHVVHLILEVQQLLHHVLIFFRRANDLATKALREKGGNWLDGGLDVQEIVGALLNGELESPEEILWKKKDQEHERWNLRAYMDVLSPELQ